MPWTPDRLSFEIIGEATDDPVVTVKITTPAGPVLVMAEAEERGRTLILRRLHVQGGAPNDIGPANIRVIARAAMEEMDYDALEIEGAARTTGAHPGRRPRPIRFTRRNRSTARRRPARR